MVVANKTQLVQVITNLVVNAAHAMDNHGTITVTATNWQPTIAEAAQLEIEAGGTYLAVSISDTGSGMDAATQARIFEPFFTTKPIGQGTGLGLSVVYGILKSWKGAITVASEIGHGATFTLYVPLRAAEGAALALTGS
jgi:signal transduction histidine kinase